LDRFRTRVCQGAIHPGSVAAHFDKSYCVYAKLLELAVLVEGEEWNMALKLSLQDAKDLALDLVHKGYH